MKIIKPDIEEMKRLVYKEPVAMLNPPDEYKKKHQGKISAVNPNVRVIKRGK